MTTTQTSTTTLTLHGREVTARGNVDLLTVPGRVAITGSRASTSYGENIAHSTAQMLAGRGAVVIASTAYGIDSAAARGALTADTGRTILVQPAGIDQTYPRGTAELAPTVEAHGGLILSMHTDPQGAPTRWDFLDAAALRGALAHHVIVVEGGFHSGTRRTTRTCSSRWAVPGPITSAASHLPHQLLREGAQAWIEDPADADTIAAATNETHPYCGEFSELLNHRCGGCHHRPQPREHPRKAAMTTLETQARQIGRRAAQSESRLNDLQRNKTLHDATARQAR